MALSPPSPAKLVSEPSATFAPVVAGHHLQLAIDGAIVAIAFGGAENSAASFNATISAALAGQAARSFVTPDNLIQLETTNTGVQATLVVEPTSDTDVLASLGLKANETAIGSGLDPTYAMELEAQMDAMRDYVTNTPSLQGLFGVDDGQYDAVIQLTKMLREGH
jgi:hypothetical protein